MSLLRIQLMRRAASARLHDARILSTSVTRASDSNYLLELLAFELLLKATALIYAGSFAQSHNYQQLFESLRPDVRNRVRTQAAYHAQQPISTQELQRLLALYGSNFVRLRYPFEAYAKMTESEYVEYGKLWVELGGPIDEAEFQYHPEELYGLVKALEEEVDAFLADQP